MPNTRTNAPRGALVFDMRQLGRQAGSSWTQRRTVPAPQDMRLELVGVPAGADVDLDVRFDAVSEGVLVTGSTTVPVEGECARCLTPLTDTVEVGFQELYLYDDGNRAREARKRQQQRAEHGQRAERHDEADEAGDEDLYFLDGDQLDLEPAFRDAVVLSLPMSPLCRDDCPGLCAECGTPLAEAGPDHKHDEATDPRWAALKQIDTESTEPDRRAGAIDLQEG
jgi:uncharacterized protein